MGTKSEGTDRAVSNACDQAEKLVRAQHLGECDAVTAGRICLSDPRHVTMVVASVVPVADQARCEEALRQAMNAINRI